MVAFRNMELLNDGGIPRLQITLLVDEARIGQYELIRSAPLMQQDKRRTEDDQQQNDKE